MKISILSRLFVVLAFLCLTTISAAAQDSGSGFGSYTSLDYDEATNTVTAYSETDTDYELMGAYGAYVGLTVTKSSGAIAASGSSYDSGGGVATIELDFAGEPDTDYRATGQHRAQVFLWDYDDDIPSHLMYYDNWHFTNFESQGINNPFYYYFSSPSYDYFYRRNNLISLGRTFDTLSTQTLSFRGSIQAQGTDISYGKSTVNLGNGVKANGNTISWKWAQNTALTAQDGIDALNLVKSKLSPLQQRNRVPAFTAAEAYIRRCKTAGGCDSNFPGQAFQGTENETHVDVLIAKGVNFKN